MPDRSRPPAAQQPQPFLLPKARRQHLSNGIPVHILAIGDLPTVKIEFVFRAGAWFEKLSGSSFFTIKMLAEGTKNDSSSDLAAFFEERGAYLEMHSGPDYCTLELMAVDRHFGDLLPKVHEMILTPTFPDEELELLKMIQKQELAVRLEKNSYLAGTILKEKLYGKDHPYGRSLTMDVIDHQQKSDLTTFYSKHIPNNFEIIVSGGASDATIDTIDRLFSESGTFKPGIFEGEVVIQPKSSKQVDRGKEHQASIRMGKPFITRHHRDFTDAYVVNEILGGYFGSRLMQNIREDKGYTYGIYSSIINKKNGAHFVIGTDAKKQYLHETLDEIRKEINRLRSEPVAVDEFNTVINYIKGTYLASITTPFSIADKLRTIYFYDLDPHYYDQLFDRLTTITPESLLLAAQEYFDPDTMTEVVVG